MSQIRRLDLDKGRYDMSTFWGRAKYYFATTNPLNTFASDEELARVKKIVQDYKAGKDVNLSDNEIWRAKELYDSAFHSQTGEKLILPGRMSFQVPGNMIITGCMMTFYKTTPAVVFWQTMNQSFNALVNYTNRNASAGVTSTQLGMAYVAATSASVLTAVGLNKLVAKSPTLSTGIVSRFVPLVAVAAATCVNIPLMRQQEIKKGIEIKTSHDEVAGASGKAAVAAIAQVVPSRIGMAAPVMALTPLIMSRLERTPRFIANPWLKAPATVLITGLCLTFSTPLCCALFPQNAKIKKTELEPELQKKVAKEFPGEDVFYYNKGL